MKSGWFVGCGGNVVSAHVWLYSVCFISSMQELHLQFFFFLIHLTCRVANELQR